MSLPIGAFPTAEAKVNLLLFTKGTRTSRIWYYDLSGLKLSKKHPLRSEHLAEFLTLLPARADGARSWTIERQAVEHNQYRLNAINPHVEHNDDQPTPEELLARIEAQEHAFVAALAQLRTPLY